MALSLPQFTDSDTGASVTYFRIDSINLPSLRGGGTISVGGYVDGNTAKAMRPVVKSEYVLTEAEAAVVRTGGLALLYSVLKARQDFSGAIDV